MPLVASGATMTVTGLTNSIRDHLSSNRFKFMCGGQNAQCDPACVASECCDDGMDKKDCSGSDSRRRRMHKMHGKDRMHHRDRMHKSSAGSALDMSELSEALVSTDKWFVNNLQQLKQGE